MLTENKTLQTVDTGLDGVPVCTSDLSQTALGADGNPVLLYRGYRIYDLVQGPFEETVYLLLYKELPTRAQLEEFRRHLARHAAIDKRVRHHLHSYPPTVHPMDQLVTALSYARLFDEEYANPLWMRPKSDPGAVAALLVRAGVRLGAKVPTLLAQGYRVRAHQEPIDPDPDLGFADNLLHMLNLPREEETVRALNTVLILYLDHTLNCSTFASLVVESAGTDPFGPLLAGALALKGVLHGGANEQAADMFDEIGRPERTRDYLHRRLQEKRLVPGFGHRLKPYKNRRESRVQIAERIGRSLAEQRGKGHLFQIYDTLCELMKREKDRAPNADLPICLLLKLIGIPKELNTPVFQASRHFGWVANNARQRRAGSPLYRPTQDYTGPDIDQMKPYVPIDQR